MNQTHPLHLTDKAIDDMVLVLEQALEYTERAGIAWEQRPTVSQLIVYLRDVRERGNPALAPHDHPEIRAMVELVAAARLGEKRLVSAAEVSFQATYIELHRALHLKQIVEADEGAFNRRFSNLLREHGWQNSELDDKPKREGRAMRVFSWHQPPEPAAKRAPSRKADPATKPAPSTSRRKRS